MGELSVVEFLEARIAEDEAVARGAYDDPFLSTADDGVWEANTSSASANVAGKAYLRIDDDEDHGHFLTHEQAEHIARHDPARVLAECAAKRAIVEGMLELERDGMTLLTDPWASATYKHSMHWFIRPFAAVYKDHPDYAKVFPDRPQTAPAA